MSVSKKAFYLVGLLEINVPKKFSKAFFLTFKLLLVFSLFQSSIAPIVCANPIIDVTLDQGKSRYPKCKSVNKYLVDNNYLPIGPKKAKSSGGFGKVHIFEEAVVKFYHPDISVDTLQSQQENQLKAQQLVGNNFCPDLGLCFPEHIFKVHIKNSTDVRYIQVMPRVKG